MTAGILKFVLEEARLSTYKVKVGAVIFKGKRIISSGYNDIRSASIHPKYKKYQNSLHAEQAALMGLDWNRVHGCSIIVVRVAPSGKLCTARPCNMCIELLKHVGITKVYYSTVEGTIVQEKLKDM